jgi:hypothetical protein
VLLVRLVRQEGQFFVEKPLGSVPMSGFFSWLFLRATSALLRVGWALSEIVDKG